MNLYQHAKDQVVSSICSGDETDFTILFYNLLQSEWLRALWPISQEPCFSDMNFSGYDTKSYELSL